MTTLSTTQLNALRGVIEQAPDAAFDRLERSLGQDALAAALGPVSDLVRVEGDERRARALVFGPLLPLCAPRGDGVLSLNFPRETPALLWRGLKARSPRKTDAAVVLSQTLGEAEGSGVRLFDELCLEAACGLRVGADGDFAAAISTLEQARTGDAEAFAGLLDVTPLARAVLPRLQGWISHMTEDAAAAARLTFKDATQIADDAGLRLIEILFAHLDEPSRILRLISAVMDRPVESYVAASELAGFGDRILDAIDRSLAEVAALNADGGAVAGVAAGRAASRAVADFAELERGVDLARDGPWGRRLARQKQALAANVEARMKQVLSAVDKALPLKPKPRGAVRGAPNIADPPDPFAVRRAQALLSFLDEIRNAAAAGGFGRPRAEAAETLSAQLDQYVEDLLDILHAGDPELAPSARAHLDVAAEFLGLVVDPKACEVARRRAAAA